MSGWLNRGIHDGKVIILFGGQGHEDRDKVVSACTSQIVDTSVYFVYVVIFDVLFDEK